MAADTDLYENAPVVLVTLELRHPDAGRLVSSEERALKRYLSDLAPIQRSAQMNVLEVTATNAGADQQVLIERFPRYVNRSKTLTVSYRQTAVVVETSVYPGWSKFVSWVEMALRARMEIAPVDAVERVGLRYIDEIRVPSSDQPITWGEWLNPSVLGPEPPNDVHLPLAFWQGACAYGEQPGHTMLMRYGPQSGFAVSFDSELRRGRQTEGGPYFLVDIDSYSTPTESFPEVDVDEVLSTCHELHQPVRRLFESLITDKLRDEVFNK